MTSVVISIDDLIEIAQEIWLSYVDPDEAHQLLPTLEEADSDGVVSAAVSVTGAWHGHVVLECSTVASRRVAAGLMGVEAGTITDEDVTDALGELSNVIGGNVKSLLPPPSVLSLPHVMTSSKAHARWPSATEVCRLSATWRGEPVSVSVLESDAAEP